jgi:2-hydroxy-3-oxopropionate reductase
MVGGKKEVFQRLWPYFQCLGKRIVHVGENGAGQVAKAANQALILITLQGLAEAFTLARQNGLPLDRVYQVLAGGSGASRILEVMGNRMIARDFNAGVEARLHYKDLGVILAEANELGLMLPATSLVAQLFNALIGRGAGREDSSQLVTVIEAMINDRP